MTQEIRSGFEAKTEDYIHLSTKELEATKTRMHRHLEQGIGDPSFIEDVLTCIAMAETIQSSGMASIIKGARI